MSSNDFYLYDNNIPEHAFLSHYRRKIDEVPLHWHNFIELELIMDGTADHIHNGILSKIKKGHISVLRINDYHSISNPDNLDVFNIAIKDTALSPKTLLSLNSVQSNLSFDLDEETFNTILFFFKSIIKENSQSNKNEDYIKNILDCIFILLLRQKPNEERPIKRQHNDQLNIAVNYLHNHFRENPSLNTIAEIAHYSPTHFSHVFHKRIGRAYNDYLNDLKVSYAKQLLTTTSLKIIDAGYQSGFNSYNNFYATFKNYTGFSPADYKKKKANNVSSMGYSWRFGIGNTNIETNPAYIYINTGILEPETEYIFSYCYSYDYIIAFERIQNSTTKQSIGIISQNSTDLKSKRRTNKVDVLFKTKSKAPYRFILKMGKGLNNVDCKYQYTLLSTLVLLKADEPDSSFNPAAEYTHLNGNVNWSENSDAHIHHIDAKV